MAVIELTAMALKPSISVTSEAFKSSLKNYLDRTSKAAGSKFELWQDLSIPSYTYLVGAWPDHDTHATFLKTDSTALLKDLAPLIDFRFTRDVEIGQKKMPTDAPILSVETFSVEPNMTEIFTGKAREAEESVSKRTAPYSVAGGFDIRDDNKKKFAKEYDMIKEGLESEGTKAPAEDTDKPTGKTATVPQNLRWVSFSGWKDEDQHLVSAKEIASPYEETREKVSMVPNIFDNIHMKLLMS